jgi:hypothetical protein
MSLPRCGWHMSGPKQNKTSSPLPRCGRRRLANKKHPSTAIMRCMVLQTRKSSPPLDQNHHAVHDAFGRGTGSTHPSPVAFSFVAMWALSPAPHQLRKLSKQTHTHVLPCRYFYDEQAQQSRTGRRLRAQEEDASRPGSTARALVQGQPLPRDTIQCATHLGTMFHPIWKTLLSGSFHLL